MISIKYSAPSAYYLAFAFTDEYEIVFGANEKNLPVTIENAVTGRENDIHDVFGGKRRVGSFLIDFAEFAGCSSLMIESCYSLYMNIGQSIPLSKAEATSKDFNILMKSTENTYYTLILNAVWNMYRVDKHLSASRLFNMRPLETCEKCAEQFREHYKNLISFHERKQIVQNNSVITVLKEYDYTVIYAKVEDFEALYAEYVTELKRKKIYCRRCRVCNTVTLFRSRNKLLCDSCAVTNIERSKREHKLNENGDTVLRQNKQNLGILYNYSHSAALRKGSPEHQRWFADFFVRYKAEAKALMKRYKNGEIPKNEAVTWFNKLGDEFYLMTGRKF